MSSKKLLEKDHKGRNRGEQMITLKDEIKELELIQKELDQARVDVRRLWLAEQVTLQSIKELKEEELKKYIGITIIKKEVIYSIDRKK